jgi:polysaccharide biosynthesis protein PslF
MSGTRLSIGIVSSALPTPCGLATFTSALGTALEELGHDVGVVRVLDVPEARGENRMHELGTLVASDPSTIAGTVDVLNRCDVVIIQHEFGLFGGLDGDDIVDVMKGLTVPIIAILHTVLLRPTEHQFEVMNDVGRLATAVVVMTATAERTLDSVFEIDDRKVSLIAHGATIVGASKDLPISDRPRLLTWGLIGPGKGIEWVIDALPSLRDLDPLPLYVVAGRTHPKVLSAFGDVYRESLKARVAANDVDDMVLFDDSYRSADALQDLIESANIVILPYDSTDQVTSGVLVDAIAAGRPVIATAFPHSIELLSTGAGLIVGHRDAADISEAIRTALTVPGYELEMAAEARRIAPSLGWAAVARQYADLARTIVAV